MHHRGLSLRWSQADPLLLASTIALTVYGVLLVTSATWHYSNVPGLLNNTWFLRQLAFAVVGCGAMLVLAALHPRLLWSFAYLFYAVSLAGLIAVLLLGHGSEDFGAQRWLDLGGLAIQPSEPAKLGLLVVLARVLGAADPPDLRHIVLSVALTGLPILLVYLQPDLGTALSLLAIWFGMLFLSGAPKRYLFTVVGLALVSAPFAWFYLLKDYMRERVLIFLDPAADALGQGYNILQSQISIGSGGLWGKGLFTGTQTQLRYLRVSHSDFIFAVLGEEMGFMGALALFALFVLLLFRALRAYELADEGFQRLICAGVVAMIAFPALANLCANVGLLPVVGIPLPFVSYGGSALVSYLAAVGLIHATLMRRRRYRFEV